MILTTGVRSQRAERSGELTKNNSKKVVANREALSNHTDYTSHRSWQTQTQRAE
jgi:hypothetical protein